MLMQTGFCKQYNGMLLAGNVLNIDNIMYWVGPCAPWLFDNNGGVAPAVLPITHSPYGKAVE